MPDAHSYHSTHHHDSFLLLPKPNQPPTENTIFAYEDPVQDALSQHSLLNMSPFIAFHLNFKEASGRKLAEASSAVPCKATLNRMKYQEFSKSCQKIMLHITLHKIRTGSFTLCINQTISIQHII